MIEIYVQNPPQKKTIHYVLVLYKTSSMSIKVHYDLHHFHGTSKNLVSTIEKYLQAETPTSPP